MIASKVVLDKNESKIYVTYPYKEDPSVLGNSLHNNLPQVIGIEKSVESRLLRNDMDEAYNSEFRKFIDIGSMTGPISLEDLRSYDGPINFIFHHEVPKPSSSTTPCRIVADSALINQTCGKSLNSILMKGPNCLNDLLEILIRLVCTRSPWSSICPRRTCASSPASWR